jgi:hypothetical protein
LNPETLAFSGDVTSTAMEVKVRIPMLYDYLRAGRSGDRIPAAAKFSASVQTGPEAHPASCTMGTGSFPEGKVQPGRDADPSAPSSAEVTNRVELYLYSP